MRARGAIFKMMMIILALKALPFQINCMHMWVRTLHVLIPSCVIYLKEKFFLEGAWRIFWIHRGPKQNALCDFRRKNIYKRFKSYAMSNAVLLGKGAHPNVNVRRYVKVEDFPSFLPCNLLPLECSILSSNRRSIELIYSPSFLIQLATKFYCKNIYLCLRIVKSSHSRKIYKFTHFPFSLKQRAEYEM